MSNMENESIRVAQTYFTMKIDQIYVINLNTDPNDIINRIEQLNLPTNTPYFIMDAVNGRDPMAIQSFGNFSTFPWKINSSNKWWNRNLTPGEVGCMLSHVKVWYDAYIKGYETVLILEEDFVPTISLKDFKLPSFEWDILYLGRNKVDNSVIEEENEGFFIPSYSYNTHAYMLSFSGIKKIVSASPHEGIIPADEFLSAMYCDHPREDVRSRFKATCKALATKEQYIKQIPTSIRPSTIETNMTQQPYFEILDASDWNAWKAKYIDKIIARGEYDLLVDEVGPRFSNIFEFPLFTQKFCDDVIALAETKNMWTEGRHEFYPTNDVLLNELGLGDIYKRVLREIVTPLATHVWQLEGAWLKNPFSEDFMIKYSMDKQGHLSLHHDYSYFTCGVKLNDEFEGGGTYFPRYGVCMTPKRNGNAFIHPGAISHKHGARPIHSGIRYIIVSFIRQHQ
jgi:GR25 family glycosyltransferase involved in LPS biosynthesis